MADPSQDFTPAVTHRIYSFFFPSPQITQLSYTPRDMTIMFGRYSASHFASLPFLLIIDSTIITSVKDISISEIRCKSALSSRSYCRTAEQVSLAWRRQFPRHQRLAQAIRGMGGFAECPTQTPCNVKSFSAHWAMSDIAWSVEYVRCSLEHIMYQQRRPGLRSLQSRISCHTKLESNDQYSSI